MFEMSVNDVPGWLVTMTPRGIGVPVAATPGLVPHCDVLTVVVLGFVLDGGLLVLLLLLHPAAASPITATSAPTARALSACSRILTSPTSWWRRHDVPLMARLATPALSSPGA
jgi:hypothetical protein